MHCWNCNIFRVLFLFCLHPTDEPRCQNFLTIVSTELFLRFLPLQITEALDYLSFI